MSVSEWTHTGWVSQVSHWMWRYEVVNMRHTRLLLAGQDTCVMVIFFFFLDNTLFKEHTLTIKNISKCISQ